MSQDSEEDVTVWISKLKDGDEEAAGKIWNKFFHRTQRLFQQADEFASILETADFRWLLPPDPSGHRVYCCWELKSDMGVYYFIVNFSNTSQLRVQLNTGTPMPGLVPVFSTHQTEPSHPEKGNEGFVIPVLEAGEGIICRLDRS